MHPEGQCSRCWVTRPTSSLHRILVQGACAAPLLILSPSACTTVTHLFPSRSLSRTRKDGARDAGFPSSSLPRTRKDGARDAGFLSPPTTTSLTTRVDTHVAGEHEARSRIETLFLENRNSSKHPPIDMTRLSYPFGVVIPSKSISLS